VEGGRARAASDDEEDLHVGSLKLAEPGPNMWLLSKAAVDALREVALQRLEAYPTGADPEADRKGLPAVGGGAWFVCTFCQRRPRPCLLVPWSRCLYSCV
jgi:hypothetical protein